MKATLHRPLSAWLPRALVVVALPLALSLAACNQAGPVEFSAGGADAGNLNRADNVDFGPMDHSIDQCKAIARKAGAGQCTQVRAYEACMKQRGYIAVLGPENPSGCGEPKWEQDARTLLR